MALERSNFGHFHSFIESQRQQGELILQPRMGFSRQAEMRRGLTAVRDLSAPTIGTITLDSYTRVGDVEEAAAAIAAREELNGYPLLNYGPESTRRMVSDLHAATFPIQVRHGTPLPEKVFRTLLAAGIDATEGGPVSYCLPYGRVPLAKSVAAWGLCSQLLAAERDHGTRSHLESFGGCMLGQLCPPALLVALTLLEGLFFVEHGLDSVSFSYAQGYSSAQDEGAILALRQLAAEWLPEVSWHVVVYTFMGMFPEARDGARELIEESARLAVRSGAQRLVVKTATESTQIPSVEDNVEALAWAHQAARSAAQEAARQGAQPATGTGDGPHSDRDFAAKVAWHREVVYTHARCLVEAVVDLAPTVGESLQLAFQRGYLDVPYCIHPDNQNQTRSWVDVEGNCRWTRSGNLPLPASLQDTIFRGRGEMSTADLVEALSFVRRQYDFDEVCDAESSQSSPGPRRDGPRNDEPRRSEPTGAAGDSDVVVLTTIPCDSHSWNLVFMQRFLEERGFRVINLGTCTPFDLVLQTCEELTPPWVVVSTVNGHGFRDARELAARFGRLRERGRMQLILGGKLDVDAQRAAEHAVALRTAGYDAVHDGPTALTDFADQLLARVSSQVDTAP